MMRLFWIVPIALATGCATAVSDSEVCRGTETAATAHAAALALDGGDRSVVTGQALIARLDAGCRR